MWQADLAEAHAVELAAIPFLERFTPSRAWPNPEFEKFDCDLWWQWNTHDHAAGVEVKYDRLAPTTGNVAVEHRSIGKSTCEFAVYVFNNQFWLLPMFELKAMIGKYPVKTGGDFNYQLTLVPAREFIRNAFLIN